MRILVTGGAGFIGSHLAEQLVHDGSEVVVLDDLSAGRSENVQHLECSARFRFERGDAADESLVSELARPCDLIFHLASAVGVARTVQEPLHVLDSNLDSTRAVVAAASRHSTRLVFASSSEVYGEHRGRPFSEDDPTILGSSRDGRWAYACSKLTGEFLVTSASRCAGFPFVIARLFNVAGPRQLLEHGMVIPRFVAQAQAGAPLTVYGDGEQTRCFMHVRDCVCALARLGSVPAAEGEVVNVGNDTGVSIRRLAELVKEVVGSSSPIERVDPEQELGPGYEVCRRRVPSLERLHRLIGETPRQTLRQIVSDVVAHRTKPFTLTESSP